MPSNRFPTSWTHVRWGARTLHQNDSPRTSEAGVTRASATAHCDLTNPCSTVYKIAVLAALAIKQSLRSCRLELHVNVVPPVPLLDRHHDAGGIIRPVQDYHSSNFSEPLPCPFQNPICSRSHFLRPRGSQGRCRCTRRFRRLETNPSRSSSNPAIRIAAGRLSWPRAARPCRSYAVLCQWLRRLKLRIPRGPRLLSSGAHPRPHGLNSVAQMRFVLSLAFVLPQKRICGPHLRRLLSPPHPGFTNCAMASLVIACPGRL